MKIFKMADEQKIPTWSEQAEIISSKPVPVENIRLNTTASDQVNEDIVSEECNLIEICASKDQSYYCNASWDKTTISHLREYATACGMRKDNFKLAHSSEVKKVQANTQTLIKTASVATQEDPNAKLKLALGDPFKLDQKFASEEPKTNWQTITKEAKMKEIPSIANGVVVPVRGGENYNKNSDINPAKNQNSITNPDAIKTLAETQEQDTGLRLRAERLAREEERTIQQREHENEIVNSMVFKDIVPRGKVFPTECLNAQNGLSSPSSERGVYAKFDKDSIPDRTAGEKIKDSNVEYKKSIQRERLVDDPMEMSREATRTVSDVLANELKKALKK